jgi:hypothetical protein
MSRTGELELEAPAVPTVYRLTQDVTNPKPDRRTRESSVTTMMVWKRGSLWVYFPADDPAKTKFPQVARLEMRNKYDRINSHDDEDRFGLLIPHLERVEIKPHVRDMTGENRDSFRAWAVLHNWEEYNLTAALQLAYYKGCLTLTEIQQLVDDIDRMDEATYDQYFG